MTLPAPYYQDDAVTIYCGDCRDILPDLPKVDLVLTDPPYGINWHGDSRSRASRLGGRLWQPIRGDDEPFDPRLMLGIGRYHIFWGANNYAALLPSRYGWLIWDKRPAGDTNTQSDAELAWTDFMGSVRTHRQRWSGCMRDGEECPFTKMNQMFGIGLLVPTQKPLALMRWCIGLTPKAETVLDPFMGSGTTLRAAKDLGRKCIGIEIEERYCEIAAKRCSQTVMKLGV
jgi:site-specific DNA-methyltransferase (adenine-specific)